jgi:hypothetical protein
MSVSIWGSDMNYLKFLGFINRQKIKPTVLPVGWFNQAQKETNISMEPPFQKTASDSHHQFDQTFSSTSQQPKPSCLDNRLQRRIRSSTIGAVRKARARSLERKESPRKSGVIAEIDLAMLCDECVLLASPEGIPLSVNDFRHAINASPVHRSRLRLGATRVGRLRLKIASVLLHVAGRLQCI